MAKLIPQPNGRGAINRQEKGDPPLNPNGRPRNKLRVQLDKWKAEGRGQISKSDVELAYLTALEMDDDELVKTSKDKTAPALLRITCEYLLKDRGFDIMERMLDRAQGKAAQPLTGGDGKGAIKIEQTVSDEEFATLFTRYAANQRTEEGSAIDADFS